MDRADALRRDSIRLEALGRAPDSRFLPMWKLNVAIAGETQACLKWLSVHEVASFQADLPTVFLGLLEGIAHFAVDVSVIESPLVELDLGEDVKFEDCRTAAMTLDGAEAGIVAQTRSQLNWHRSHLYCGSCGTETQVMRGGHVRHCPGCERDQFPRTDPVAIMLITHDDQCLLGQSAGRMAASSFYSALAGFIDQGEAIEEAVRREVQEEAGIIVGEVRYHSSQPWPFPSSLMIGCHGQATTTDIVIDTTEMADVRWFDRATVIESLDGRRDDLRVPGAMAIAHHLINDWARGRVAPF